MLLMLSMVLLALGAVVEGNCFCTRYCLWTASAWCMMHFRRSIRCLRVGGEEEGEACVDGVGDVEEGLFESVSLLPLLREEASEEEEPARLMEGAD